jgi:hypothetical protein
MRTLIYFFFIIFLNTTCTFSQTTFYDGFETGDFSKWDNNVGATISSAFKHTGNYSAKFEITNTEKKILKTNNSTNYIKIDFYAYITSWNQAYASLRAGGNGWVWYWEIWSVNNSYFINCNHTNLGTFNEYFPMNNWNHIVLERTATGYGYAWINGAQYLDGVNVGTCDISDVTLGCFPGYSYITCYLDDVNIYYIPVGVKPIETEVPKKYNLSQNYPNPFNPTTNIKFDLPKSSLVKLTIYDALGREIETLVNEKLKEGSYQVNWNASQYPSGVYFYRLLAGDFSDTKKMVLIK